MMMVMRTRRRRRLTYEAQVEIFSSMDVSNSRGRVGFELPLPLAKKILDSREVLFVDSKILAKFIPSMV